VVIVAGHIVVDGQDRADYLSGCVEVVRQARQGGRGVPRQWSQRRAGRSDSRRRGRRIRHRRREKPDVRAGHWQYECVENESAC